MPKGDISVDGPHIAIASSDGTHYSMTRSQLTKCYILLVGHEIMANDSICYVLIFDKELWVIPNSTAGIYHLKSWIAPLLGDDTAVVAQLDHQPFTWRAKRFFFGLEAKLAVKKSDTFSQIESDITILHNVTIDDVF